MRRASFNGLLVVSMVIVSVLAGCKKDSPAPTAPSTSGGTAGTPVSPAQRLAAISAVMKADSALDWSNPATAKLQLLQVLQNRSEIEASGANTDASVWARFTDDRLWIIAHNRLANDTAGGGSPGVLPHQLMSIPGGELPTSHNVTIMNAMGTAFTDVTGKIYNMFKAKGYNPNRVPGSISNLKSVSGDAAFYIDSHGGWGVLRNGTLYYGIWTTDKFDTVSDASVKTLFENGELVYFTAVNDLLIPGIALTATTETHFGITAKFVTNEMSFGKNSLIYIDACSSNSFGAQSFKAACLSKSTGGTAAYAGWSDPVDDGSAVNAAYFIIDRLLGTNMDLRYPEIPPQRPFTYPQIMTELASKHLNVSQNGIAVLTISPPTASFGIFAPSIEYMIVDEQRHELQVYGLFGSDLADAQLTLNDQAVNLSQRSPGEFVGLLDTKTQNTGGDVKAIIHGDTSNVVRLTEWKGKIQVAATLPGSLGYTITYDFHIRADVHSYRSAPGTTPMPWPAQGGMGMPDTRADCLIGGVLTDNFAAGGGCTQKIIESWAVVHDSATPAGNPLKSVTIAADIRPQVPTISLYLFVTMANITTDITSDTTYCPGSNPQGGKFTTPFTLSASDTMEFQFSNTFDLIDPGPKSHPTGMAVAYSLDPNLTLGTVTLSFLGATTSYPPDPKAGQKPIAKRGGEGQTRARR